MVLKSVEYYQNLKKRLAKYNKIYKDNIAPKPYVGDNSKLYSILKPTSYQDFFDKYTTYLPTPNYIPKNLKGSQEYGRSIEHLQMLAGRYKELVNDDAFTVEDFFDDIVCHVIIETFDGHKPERELVRILSEKGYEVEETSGVMDSEYGVDLIVSKDGEVKEYIQVKPLSTFLGTKNCSLKNDRSNFFIKQSLLNDFADGHPDFRKRDIIYMLYNYNHLIKYNEVLWCYKGDKVKFKLNELCRTDGIPLVEYRDFTFKKLILKK